MLKLLFTMKKLFSVLYIAVILMSCNQSENEHKKSKEHATSQITENASVSIILTDPDTTDNYPAGSYGINSSSIETASKIRSRLQQLFKDDLEKSLIDDNSRRFVFFEYDLNGDSLKEILVGFTGMYFCGSGGCTIYLFDNQLHVNTIFTVSDYPVVIDRSRSNAWNDLFIYSAGKHHIMRFDGKKYPANPSVEPVLETLPGDGLPRALNFMNEPYPWFSF